MKVVGIIPARYNSTRLPGKPLKMIGDISLIMRVFRQCKKVALFNDVVVATDDERIFKHVQESGGKVVMTSADHSSGTERCHEALGKINGHFDFVVNVQGDEPFINPEHITKLISSLTHETQVATLCMPVTEEDELSDPGIPKLVIDNNEHALYFSRSLIPYDRSQSGKAIIGVVNYLKHIGIYAYRSDTLATIVKLEPSKLELIEQLEQLRWLDNGVRIRTVKVPSEKSISVDTEIDLQKARNLVQ